MTKKEDQELLSTLIDFMGSIENANDTSEFQEVKKQMLESGMTTEDLFTLLGDNFAETLANRRIIDVPFQKLILYTLYPFQHLMLIHHILRMEFLIIQIVLELYHLLHIIHVKLEILHPFVLNIL